MDASPSTAPLKWSWPRFGRIAMMFALVGPMSGAFAVGLAEAVFMAAADIYGRFSGHPIPETAGTGMMIGALALVAFVGFASLAGWFLGLPFALATGLLFAFLAIRHRRSTWLDAYGVTFAVTLIGAYLKLPMSMLSHQEGALEGPFPIWLLLFASSVGTYVSWRFSRAEFSPEPIVSIG